MERKKLIELVGSIFVALIFLSSYAAFGNVSPSNSNGTTTLRPSQTVYATANGNAIITSYGGVMNINVLCSNVTSVSNSLNSELQVLERNGSVSNFYSQQAAQILVQAGNTSTYPLFLLLYKDTGTYASCTNFTSTANVKLPNRMTFYIPSQSTSAIISIPSDMQAYSLPVELHRNMSDTINVTASALLTLNGSIYGSMRVTQA